MKAELNRIAPGTQLYDANCTADFAQDLATKTRKINELESNYNHIDTTGIPIVDLLIFLETQSQFAVDWKTKHRITSIMTR